MLFHIWGIYVMFLMSKFCVIVCNWGRMPTIFLCIDLRLIFWILFHCPVLIIKPWYDIVFPMNCLVLCSFIYKMRLLQPCGGISNDLRNIIQLIAKSKTRNGESQHHETGKRLWDELPGLRLHLMRQNSFQDRRAFVTWLQSQDVGLQPIVVQYIGFLQPCLLDSEEPQFWLQGKEKWAFLCGLSMNAASFHETIPFQIEEAMAKLTLFLLHLQNSLVWCTNIFNEQFSSSFWVSVTVLHIRAVATR